MIITIFTAAILIALSPALQLSHAQTFAETILEIHNRERAAVSVPPLAWNDNLAADAQNWANQLPPLRHAQGISQGENLWSGGPSGAFTTDRQVQTWVDEKNNYDGSPIGETQGTGHYTQMVWQTTTDIGCATATSGDSDFLVCRYSPAGNILGQTPYSANQTTAAPTEQPSTAPPANQTAAAPPEDQCPAGTIGTPPNCEVPQIPIVRPERAPTEQPSAAPTEQPSAAPTEQPSAAPPANQTAAAPPDEEYRDFFAIFFSFSDEEYGGLNEDVDGGGLYDLFNRILGP